MAGNGTTIPERLEAEVLRLSGERWSTRKISAWLSSEHGIELSHVGVSRFLKDQREERHEATKDIVRESLGRTVTQDIEALGGAIAKLGAEADRALQAGDRNLWLRILEQQRKHIDTRLHYSGADIPDGMSTLASLLAQGFPTSVPDAGLDD